MEYAPTLKQACQTATRDVIAGGTLELGTAGMAVVLGTAVLGRGDVSGETLTIPVEDVLVKAEGTVAAARIRTARQVVAMTGLTVGDEGSSADIVLAFRKLGPGAVVSLGSVTILLP